LTAWIEKKSRENIRATACVWHQTNYYYREDVRKTATELRGGYLNIRKKN